MHVGASMKAVDYALSRSKSRRLDAVVEAMLREVKPSEREIRDTTRMANELMGRLKGALPRNVEIILAGSIARGTQMSGNTDIDIFLLFPKSAAKDELERKGLSAARSIIDTKKNERCEVKYAEHPYARLSLEDMGITVDVVPAYRIAKADEMGTAVDRTQLHNEFVIAHMTQKQRDAVRVMKAFLDRHGIYGAEAMTEGFSGYLCELLVHHYGSFQQAVAAFAAAKTPLVIDPEKRAVMTGAAASAQIKKFNSAFIVIDPTDSDRNVAANVSPDSLARASLASRALLRNPGKGTFNRAGHSDVGARGRLSSLAKGLGASVYVVNFVAPDIAEDIIWQQLKRLSVRLGTALGSNGFTPLMSLQRLHERDALVAFIVRDALIKAELAKGPSAFMAEAASRFIRARKGNGLVSLEGDRLYAIRPPRFRTPKELLQKFLTGRGAELPSHLKRKSMRIYVNSMPESIARLVYQAYAARKLDYKV